MEASDPCFIFNFRRANGTSTARGCRARPSGTSPERGRGKHTQRTAKTHLLLPPGSPAALPCLAPGASLGAGSLHTSGLGGEAARSGAGCRHGLPRGQPSCLQSHRATEEESTPTSSQEPGFKGRKEITKPVEAGELGVVFLPASLREEIRTGRAAGGKLALASKTAQKQPPVASQPFCLQNTPLSAGDFKALLPSPESRAQHKHGVDSNSASATAASAILANSEHIWDGDQPALPPPTVPPTYKTTPAAATTVKGSFML